MGLNLAFKWLKMKAACSFETSGTNHTATQRHIPEERSPEVHRCESLITPKTQTLVT